MIKLEQTQDPENVHSYGTVIYSDRNDMTMTELADLMRAFAVAVGYHHKNVEEAIGEIT